MSLAMMGVAANSLAQSAELVLRESLESGFAQAYRVNTLVLRDPHVATLVPVFGCVDFTDEPIPLTQFSLNAQIAATLNGDGNGDSLLDYSNILGMDRLAPDSLGQMVSTFSADCPSPAPPDTCSAVEPLPPSVASANADLDICLTALPMTTSGYNPPVPEVTPPCWVSDNTPLEVSLGDLIVPLNSARLAATWVNGGESLSNGLLMGFLSEASADQILLPVDLPLIGGQPLSVILPGGSGNCAANDDRDMFNSETGWWFYLETTALPVSLSID